MALKIQGSQMKLREAAVRVYASNLLQDLVVDSDCSWLPQMPRHDDGEPAAVANPRTCIDLIVYGRDTRPAATMQLI